MSTVLIEIRRAKPADADDVALAHDEAWRSAYQGIIPGTELDKLISRRGPDWWHSAIRKGSRIALMQFPTFLVLFLAPVYVPLSLLSGWIHAIASINPVTALLEAGRGFISGDPAVVGLAFAVAIALPLLFALWAKGGLRSAEAAG